MSLKKLSQPFVRCSRTQYVFPFVNAAAADSVLAPLFRLKHAKIIASESNGRYDPENDAFVIPEGDDEKVYTGTVQIVKGKPTKLYQLGPEWNWQLIGDDKVFEACWSNDFCNPGKYYVAEDFFAEDRCYDPDEVLTVRGLPVGGSWQSNDYGSAHTATRIA
jgi:hypothetical protein